MLYQGTHAPLQSGLICQLANRARSFSVVRRGTLSSETRTDIYKYTPGDRFTGHHMLVAVHPCILTRQRSFNRAWPRAAVTLPNIWTSTSSSRAGGPAGRGSSS